MCMSCLRASPLAFFSILLANFGPTKTKLRFSASTIYFSLTSHYLFRLVKAEPTSTKLVVSSISMRRDKPGLQQKVNELNAEIKDCLPYDLVAKYHAYDGFGLSSLQMTYSYLT